MDNQNKDFKPEKDNKRSSQTRKEKSAKRELENARKKKGTYWKKQDLRIACENFICSMFLNLKVDIIVVTSNKLNILLELNFDLNVVNNFVLCSFFISTVWLVSKINYITLNMHVF